MNEKSMGAPQEEVTPEEEKIKAEEELKNKEGEIDPAEGSEEKPDGIKEKEGRIGWLKKKIAEVKKERGKETLDDEEDKDVKKWKEMKIVISRGENITETNEKLSSLTKKFYEEDASKVLKMIIELGYTKEIDEETKETYYRLAEPEKKIADAYKDTVKRQYCADVIAKISESVPVNDAYIDCLLKDYENNIGKRKFLSLANGIARKENVSDESFIKIIEASFNDDSKWAHLEVDENIKRLKERLKESVSQKKGFSKKKTERIDNLKNFLKERGKEEEAEELEEILS